MSDELNNNEEEQTGPDYLGVNDDTSGDTIKKVTGMYRDWFWITPAT
tara:strand:+ start:191 stop:331 length:141 start_codon:yes stop_codon:yes gene_type:complete